MPAGVVKWSIKPVFIGWITLLMQFPMQLFFTVWCGGFFGGMGTVAGIFPQNSRLASYGIGAIAFFAIPIVAYVGNTAMASEPAHIINTEIIIEFLRPYLSAMKPKT